MICKCGHQLANPDLSIGRWAELVRCPSVECRKPLSEEIHMKRLIHCVAALALLCCAGFAQTPPAEQPASNAPKVLPAATPLGTGPIKAIMEVDPTLAKHTVYRPNDMNAVGSAKLPIMAWGNGACAADGNAFRLFLTEIASHGYLVIANGPIGPDRAQFPPTMPPNRGAARSWCPARNLLFLPG